MIVCSTCGKTFTHMVEQVNVVTSEPGVVYCAMCSRCDWVDGKPIVQKNSPGLLVSLELRENHGS
jgi:hypothetical protein